MDFVVNPILIIVEDYFKWLEVISFAYIWVEATYVPYRVVDQMRHGGARKDHWEAISRVLPQRIACKGLVPNVGHEGVPPIKFPTVA